MPIKFACPKCKNVLQVSSEMAGKTGKCKCAAQVRIPTPKPATAAKPAAPSAAPSSAMFDELTEGDYGREDPYTELYTGKKTNNDAQSLGRFTNEIKEEKQKEFKQVRGLMIFAAILNILGALGFIALGVLLIVVSSFLTDVEGITEAFPILGVGLTIATVWSFGMAILFLVSGVGGIMGTSWGWVTMAIVYTYSVVDRLVGFGMFFTDEFKMGAFFGQMIGCLAMISLAIFIYKESTREMCHIKSKIPVIVAPILGVVLAGATWGAVFAIGAEAVKQADAAEVDAAAE